MHHGVVERLVGADPLVDLLPRAPGARVRARDGLLLEEQAAEAVRQPDLRQRVRGARGAVRLRAEGELRQSVLQRDHVHAARQRELRDGRVLRPENVPAENRGHRVQKRRARVRPARVLHRAERVLPGGRVQDGRRGVQHGESVLLPGLVQDPQRSVQTALGPHGDLVRRAVLRDEHERDEARQLRLQPDRIQLRQVHRRVRRRFFRSPGTARG